MNISRTLDRPKAVPDSVTQLYRYARKQLLLNEPFDSSAVARDSSLTEAEHSVLERVGLSTEYPQGAVLDPGEQSIAEYMALLETSLSTADVARALKVDPSRVRQRLRERSLYGLDYDGEKRLPRFQFHGHRVLPGLREVLAALPEQLNPLDVAQWFLSPNEDLEIDSENSPLSPRAWLLRGEPVTRVAQLAKQFE